MEGYEALPIVISHLSASVGKKKEIHLCMSRGGRAAEVVGENAYFFLFNKKKKKKFFSDITIFPQGNWFCSKYDTYNSHIAHTL